MENIRYEKHVVPDPARPYIYHKATEKIYFLPHWHENIEILYFHTEGSVVCDRELYSVHKHDIAIFGSNSLHSIPKEAAAEYDCLIVDCGFLAENNIDALNLTFECVISSHEAAELFQEAAKEITDSIKPFKAAATKTAILSLMVFLCRGWARSRTMQISSERANGAVRRAIGYINSNLSKPMTIDEIADNVMVSKYYFCREFRRETGYTVIRYINYLRCREAERLLRNGQATVSEIARLLGYDNLSYFTRTFKSITGKTPSELREIFPENEL